MIQQRGWKIGHLQCAFGAERVQPVDAMLQLADVARPVVGKKSLEQFLAGLDSLQSGGVSVAQEVIYQQRYVLLTLAQWRQSDSEDVEAVKQVQAEATGGHLGARVAVRRHCREPTARNSFS
jgi:hypothetical protein